MNLSIKVIIL